MVKYTRKNKIGGDINIFSKYDPEDVRRKLDNYLAASYALKQSTEELNEAIRLMNNSRNSNSTSMIERKNSEDFLKAVQTFTGLISSLKTNIR
jgi:phosphotransacetylase